jgi:hypothetical protein
LLLGGLGFHICENADNLVSYKLPAFFFFFFGIELLEFLGFIFKYFDLCLRFLYEALCFFAIIVKKLLFEKDLVVCT